MNMAFYNDKEQIYLETDVLGIDLGEFSVSKGQQKFPKE